MPVGLNFIFTCLVRYKCCINYKLKTQFNAIVNNTVHRWSIFQIERLMATLNLAPDTCPKEQNFCYFIVLSKIKFFYVNIRVQK